jgi:hypothetical protein
MNTLRRMIITISLVTALLPLSLGALGVAAHGSQGGSRDMLCRQLGLRDVESIPPGIEPLVVSTAEELREIVRQTRAILGRSLATPATVAESGLELGALSLNEACQSFHYWMTVNPVLGTRFNLWADVWLAGSGSFWEITTAFEWIDLSGFTPIQDLTREWHYHVIASDRQSITVAGGATLNTYLLYKGLFRVYSEPISIRFTYRLR